MVHCTKCGSENREDARYCVQCGALLHPSRERDEKHEKSERDVCFGPPPSARFFWLFVGLLVILWGIAQLLESVLGISLNTGALVLIAIGLYIVYRVLSRPRRR